MSTTTTRMVDRVCQHCGLPFQRNAAILGLIDPRYCFRVECGLSRIAPGPGNDETLDELFGAFRRMGELVAASAAKRARIETTPDRPAGFGPGFLEVLAQRHAEYPPPPGGWKIPDFGKLARRRLPLDAAGMFTVGWGVDPSREPPHGIIKSLRLGEDKPKAPEQPQPTRKPSDSTPPASRATLRQHFAGQAMQGYIASMHRCPECGPSEPVEFASAIARDSVRMADALIDALKEPRA